MTGIEIPETKQNGTQGNFLFCSYPTGSCPRLVPGSRKAPMPTECSAAPLATGVRLPRLAMAGLWRLTEAPRGRVTFLADDWCFSAGERRQPGRCSRAHCYCQTRGPARRVHARACLPRGARRYSLHQPPTNRDDPQRDPRPRRPLHPSSSPQPVPARGPTRRLAQEPKPLASESISWGVPSAELNGVRDEFRSMKNKKSDDQNRDGNT